MLFEIIRSEGIAHNSYIVGSEGKAAVIDPRRDCGIYFRIADAAGMVITYVFETHRNEDYCTGSTGIAARHPVEILHGSQLPFRFGRPVHDGDRFVLGSLELTVLETPGHTEESISIVLTDHAVAGEPYMVFTGDTLLAGEIGRTDFFGRDKDAEMAGKIYDSISDKILSLGDGVIICPAHGAGSVCGSAIADHPITTVGYERRTNPHLLMGRKKFVSARTRESHYLLPYFRRMEEYNLSGTPLLGRIPQLSPLSTRQVQELMQQGAQILDIRLPPGFAAAHVPGSLSIWRDGVSSFAGWFLDYDHPIVIIDDFNLDLSPVIRQLFRIGYDNLAGFLAGGFGSWFRSMQETASFKVCTARELHTRLEEESPFILDVREMRNFRAYGHIRGAHHIFVGELPQHLAEIQKECPIVVTCDAGYKGSLAASFLARNGFTDITNLLGGMKAWTREGFPVVKR